MDAVILPWPRHVRYNCADDCVGCWCCEGALLSCVVCKCAEGTLTTECPGVVVSEPFQELIMRGKLDYTRRDQWHDPRAR